MEGSELEPKSLAPPGQHPRHPCPEDQDLIYGYAIPTVPYSSRPPSPPSITIPTPTIAENGGPIKVVPSYANVDPADLSPEQLDIITGGLREQTARDSTGSWNYSERRQAQAILDCLYLGPSNVARDREWLTANGITMLLAVRDSRFASARLMFADAIAQELGIQADYIDIENQMGMIRSLPDAVRKINNHFLDVYHRQAVPAASGGQATEGSMFINRQDFKRGKVLVFCETGNDRSPIVVVAYMMAVLGMNMVRACQFIHYRRFCINLSEEMKFLLQTYEGLLDARRTVNQHRAAAPAIDSSTQRRLRRTADEMDKDDEQDNDTPRPGQAPFAEQDDVDMDGNKDMEMAA
ncbi:uncharacterized protein PG998_003365 [Apiospora kogelbergensis]|uniref:Tyrosine specific protein phosphatases domain-containing protein n=1 Tax=Apiospora kogelbergensis TaxID=1337665 RepID=A0AAW0QNQ4_9PEZI